MTDACNGGNMLQWASRYRMDMSVSDVSRIAFQLLTAVSHCYDHGVIHRDIKPENIMFEQISRYCDIRLIDFGSCRKREISKDHSPTQRRHDVWNRTMAGTPFYTAPEMFQRKYSFEVDVWSVGVVLYVLVAGYPGDDLQDAFNLFHTSSSKTAVVKIRNLELLPNYPVTTYPRSFCDLLDGLCTYDLHHRELASMLLQHKFIQLRDDSMQDCESISKI